MVKKYHQQDVQILLKNQVYSYEETLNQDKIWLAHILIVQPGLSGQKPSNAAAKPTKSAIVAKGQKLSSKDKIPLIIVPAAPTAKFTLYNIKKFLEDQM